jgi:hypothetical protein
MPGLCACLLLLLLVFVGAVNVYVSCSGYNGNTYDGVRIGMGGKIHDERREPPTVYGCCWPDNVFLQNSHMFFPTLMMDMLGFGLKFGCLLKMQKKYYCCKKSFDIMPNRFRRL